MQKEIEKLRHKFRKARSELFQRVSWTAPSRDLLEAHASFVDGIIKEIYQISYQAANHTVSRSRHSGLAMSISE